MTFRSKKLLDYAKDCPECMDCGNVNYDGHQLCAAHIPTGAEFKGTGMKPADNLIAYVCQHCHDSMDGRAKRINIQERMEHWSRAHLRSWVWLMESGRVKVA